MKKNKLNNQIKWFLSLGIILFFSFMPKFSWHWNSSINEQTPPKNGENCEPRTKTDTKYLYTFPTIKKHILPGNKIANIANSADDDKTTEPFTVVTSDDQKTTVHFTLPSFQIQNSILNGIKVSQVVAKFASKIKYADAPELPCYNSSLLIPNDSKLEIIIKQADFYEIAINTPLPSRGFIPRSEELPALKFGSVYHDNQPFPGLLCTPSKPFKIRKQSGTSVAVYPFQYFAERGILRVYKNIEFELKHHSKKELILRNETPTFNSFIAKTFANSGMATREESPTPPEDNLDKLLIIIAEDFANSAELQEFITWKRQLGIEVTTAIYNDTNFADSAALANYIQTRYDNDNISYLIIIGDEEFIPVEKTSPTPSDTGYSLVSGADIYHDLFASRISIKTTAELANQLQKIIDYEKTPFVEVGNDWHHKALLVASDQGATTSMFDKDDWQILDEEIPQLQEYGFTNFAKAYDEGVNATLSEVITPWNSGCSMIYYLGHGDPQSWSTTGLDNDDIATLTNGKKLPFIFNGNCQTGNFLYSGGDCLAEAMIKAGTQNNPAGAIGVLSSTTNMSWDPPIAILQAMNEYITKKTPFTAGAITFDTPGDAITLGGLNTYSIQRGIDFCLNSMNEGEDEATELSSQLHLFGDCTMTLRTSTPQNIQVNHPAKLDSSQSFIIQVLNPTTNQTIKKARISFYQPATGYQAIFESDENGIANIDFSNQPAPLQFNAPLTITVFHHKYQVYQTELTFANQPLSIYSSSTLPVAFINDAYSFTHLASSGTKPYTWSIITGSCTPFTLNANSGTISGTATTATTINYTIRVTDADSAQYEQQISLEIGNPLEITTTTLPTGTVNELYNYSISSTGTFTPFSYNCHGILPTGITFSNGNFSGTPLQSGTFSITIKATDQKGVTTSKNFDLEINPSIQFNIITPNNLGSHNTPAQLNQTFTASGGSGTGYIWQLESGIIPNGLNFANGQLSGTTNDAGNFTFTIKVEDDANPVHSVSKEFTITIIGDISFQNPTPKTAYLGSAFHYQTQLNHAIAPITYTINNNAEEYQNAESATSYQTIGTEQNISDDAILTELNLGFSFPFYKNNYTTCKLSAKGFIIFENSIGDIFNPATPNFKQHKMIAPFWCDLYLDANLKNEYPGCGIFIEKTADSITICWKLPTYQNWVSRVKQLQEASLTLHKNGNIEFKYGNIILSESFLVGVSAGDELNNLELFYNSPNNNDEVNWSNHDDFNITSQVTNFTIDEYGLVTGLATKTGTYNFTIHATDHNNNSDFTQLQITTLNPIADQNSDGKIDDCEILSYIDSWRNSEVLLDDLNSAIDQWKSEISRELRTPQNNLKTTNSIGRGADNIKRSRPDGYYDYEELTEKLSQYCTDYPHLCALHSLGKSIEGREIWAIKISDNPHQNEDEPEVKLVSCIHGDEAISTELMIKYLDHILANYATNSTFINSHELWIVPLMNPDGSENSTRTNSNGIDLNRNFPDAIETTIPAYYPNKILDTNSVETEVQKIMQWSAKHNFIMSAALHSGDELVCYPYGNNITHTSVTTPTPDNELFIEMALNYTINHTTLYNSASHLSNYPSYQHGIINGADWYQVTGEMADWNYHTTGCFENTIELNTTKMPSISQIEPIWLRHKNALLNYFNPIQQGIHGIVRDAQTNQPLWAEIEVIGNQHKIYTEPQNGDFYRPLPTGTYSLLINAEGYHPQAFHNLTINSSSTINITANLTPKEQHHAKHRKAAEFANGGDTITIQVDLYLNKNQSPSGIIITETLPAGTTYLVNSSTIGEPRIIGNKLAWLIYGTDLQSSTFAYQITLPPSRSQNSLMITGELRTLHDQSSIKPFTIFLNSNETYKLVLKTGWNFISFPLNLNNKQTSANFANNQSLWAWNGHSYYKASELQPKVGYLYYSTINKEIYLQGAVVNDKSCELRTGWNLISPLNDGALPTNNAIDNPIFGWENNIYTTPNQLKKGQCYWIHTNSNITIQLP